MLLRFFCCLFLIQLGLVSGTFDPSNYAGSRALNSDYTVYWQVDQSEGRLNLALVVKTVGWVGFGFGEPESGSMPGSDIVTVTFENGPTAPVITDRYAMGFTYPEEDLCQSWTLISSSQSGGITTVEISRKLNTEDEQDRVVSSGATRIVYAYGSNTNLALTYHQTRRGASLIDFYIGGNGEDEEPGYPETDVVSAELLAGDYAIPPQRTTYICRARPIPLPQGSADRHVIKLEPIIDPRNTQTAHHMLIHICSNNSVNSAVNKFYDAPGQCVTPVGDTSSGCFSLLYSWAIGIGSLVLPKEAGYRMGFSLEAFQYVVIEIHYDNPSLSSSLVDNSGFRMYYTSQLRQYDAGTLIVGDPLLMFADIPPGISSNTYEASCPSECTSKFTSELHVFAEFLHMHAIGKMIWSTQYRNGEFIRTMNRAEFYSYDFQQQTLLNYTIQPGDSINLHCVYDSSSQSGPTQFGLESYDEMCMDFVSYYPKMQFQGSDFAYCGYYRFLRNTMTVCGSSEGLMTGEAIIDVKNPAFSDLEEGLDRIFGQEHECKVEEEDDKDKKTAYIIGGVLVGVAVLGLAFVGVFYYRKRRQFQYEPINEAAK